MKSKWYRSSPAKGVLIGLCLVCAVMMAVSLAWFGCYPSIAQEAFEGDGTETFEESAAFQDEVDGYAFHLLDALSYKSNFESKGGYDPEKVVDVSAFYKGGVVTGKNESGLAYRLGDLVEWGEALETEEAGSIAATEEAALAEEDPSMEQIVVCEKADKSYQYYTWTDFYGQVLSGAFQFVLTEDAEENGITSSLLLEMLKTGAWHSDGYEYGDGEEVPVYGDGEEILEYYTTGDILDCFKEIQDADGNILYVDCWCYDGEQLAERYAPLEKESLLQLANEDGRWNGKLQDAFQMVEQTARTLYGDYTIYESFGEGLEEGSTNFSYLCTDIQNQQVLTNRAAFLDYARVEDSLETMKVEGKYIIVRSRQSDLETDMHYANKENWYEQVMQLSEASALPDDRGFVFAVSVDTGFPIHDSFYSGASDYNAHIQELPAALLCAAAGLSVFLLCIVWLTVIAGRKRTDESLHLMAFDQIKTEPAAVLVCGVWGVLFYLGVCGVWRWATVRQVDTGSFAYSVVQSEIAHPSRFMVGAGILGAFSCAMFLLGGLSLVRRIKARALWKNSLLRIIWGWGAGFLRIVWGWAVQLLRGAWGFWKKWMKETRAFVKTFLANINSLWKASICFCGFLLIQWGLMASIADQSGFFLGLFGPLSLLADGVVFVYLVKKKLGDVKIQEGIRKIAGGDVGYKIDAKGLTPEQNVIAEGINTIGRGLDAAVEKSMKSERLKTDLITNVSHDIKTPLTSIINYVDLLKQEQLDDPKVQHYIEVLEEKSQRLKTLTEDVVEASKISSGNIHLEYIHLDFAEMIRQTSGEFAEKFAAKGLKEIQKIPAGDVIIRVDSRRTWRIFENLYGNAAKYSMPDTRVYTELTTDGKEAVFSMKNISEQPLNVSADELMERFVRGDVARSTEGAGLGLSIAQTLTQMQGGKFDLYLDGDLFKVTVCFKVQ